MYVCMHCTAITVVMSSLRAVFLNCVRAYIQISWRLGNVGFGSVQAYASFKKLTPEASFLKASSRLHGKFAPTQQWRLRSSWRLGAKLAPTQVLKNCPLVIYPVITMYVWKGRFLTFKFLPSCQISYPAGLPDGFFSNQKYKFGQILEGLRWENVDTFKAIWHI
jgi:hypothetical protein